MYVNRDKTGVLTGGCTGEVQCSKSHLIFQLMRWFWITNTLTALFNIGGDGPGTYVPSHVEWTQKGPC